MPLRPDKENAVRFHIDEAKYRIVDLSTRIAPPGTEDRPFRVERGRLADDSFKHDVSTHTHVGTHIESPAHFFEGGRRLAREAQGQAHHD